MFLTFLHNKLVSVIVQVFVDPRPMAYRSIHPWWSRIIWPDFWACCIGFTWPWIERNVRVWSLRHGGLVFARMCVQCARMFEIMLALHALHMYFKAVDVCWRCVLSLSLAVVASCFAVCQWFIAIISASFASYRNVKDDFYPHDMTRLIRNFATDTRRVRTCWRVRNVRRRFLMNALKPGCIFSLKVVQLISYVTCGKLKLPILIKPNYSWNVCKGQLD